MREGCLRAPETPQPPITKAIIVLLITTTNNHLAPHLPHTHALIRVMFIFRCAVWPSRAMAVR